MPNINEMLDRLKGANYFQECVFLELEKKSKEKTALLTKSDQYYFFGIAAASGTFQEMMGKVCNDLSR